MIRDLERAHAPLADAIWRFKGFDAARPPASIHDGPTSEAGSLALQLREVREFLNDLADGRIRRLGDEKAVVLTYAEFDVLVDSIRPDATERDRKRAERVADVVLNALLDEARDTRNRSEIPF